MFRQKILEKEVRLAEEESKRFERLQKSFDKFMLKKFKIFLKAAKHHFLKEAGRSFCKHYRINEKHQDYLMEVRLLSFVKKGVIELCYLDEEQGNRILDKLESHLIGSKYEFFVGFELKLEFQGYGWFTFELTDGERNKINIKDRALERIEREKLERQRRRKKEELKLHKFILKHFKQFLSNAVKYYLYECEKFGDYSECIVLPFAWYHYINSFDTNSRPILNNEYKFRLLAECNEIMKKSKFDFSPFELDCISEANRALICLRFKLKLI